MNELIADELTKLAQLRDQGVLTEGEFAARKALLLDRKPESNTPVALKAFFGCLGALLLFFLVPAILAFFGGKSTTERTDPVVDASNAANGAASAAAASASQAAHSVEPQEE